MKKRSMLASILGAAFFLAACAGGGSSGTGAVTAHAPDEPVGECGISAQSRQLNATLRAAAEADGDLDAIVGSSAAQIEVLGSEAGGGAVAQRNASREASCRAISLRAYGALLRSTAHAPAALTAIATQAEAGDRACSAITTLDVGSRADCDLIAMWSHTIAGFAAARELQSIGTIAVGANAPVAEDTWERVNTQARIVQDNVNHWSDAAQPQTPAMVRVVAGQRTRLVCSAWAPLATMRNLEGRGGPGWQRVYATTYPSLMRDAANALSIPNTAECRPSDRQACDLSRVLELERICRQVAGR